ncbi:MAG: lysostaphin resistance A-like protein [Leisingera sp.]
MSFIVNTLPQIWPWLILMAALAAGWSGLRRTALFLLALAATGALAASHLTAAGLALLIAGLSAAALLPRLAGPAAIAGHTALLLVCLALGLHIVPGVHNLLILDQVQSGPASAPYSLHLNLDKPLVFVALLLAWPPLLKDGAAASRPATLAATLLLAALFPLALAAGALRFEPGLPAWALLWMLSNLLLTCLAEEAFFRSYIQQGLTRRFGAAAGIAAASLLFGLAHIGAGPAVTVFATLLGLACGLGYWGSGRFRVPVLMHFAFNLIHLLLFTYPGPV